MTAPLSPDRTALLRAADHIDRWGWCQHVAYNDVGGVCTMQAIYIVSHTLSDYAAIQIRLTHFLKENPLYWNDASGRTKEQVTTALRAAAISDL